MFPNVLFVTYHTSHLISMHSIQSAGSPLLRC